MNTYVILHDVRSVANVGSIFRTADGVGVQKIFLTGITPTPVDRFGRVRSEMHKTALGATEYFAWEHVLSAIELMKRLTEEGVAVVAVEQHADSTDYSKYVQTSDTAYFLVARLMVCPKSCASTRWQSLKYLWRAKRNLSMLPWQWELFFSTYQNCTKKYGTSLL